MTVNIVGPGTATPGPSLPCNGCLPFNSDSEPTLDELEEELLRTTRPKSKDDALPAHQPDEQTAELSEQALGVLNALAGEIDDKRTS